MRECGQQTFGGCDPATCDRQCSATIIIREQSKASLAAFIFPAAIAALAMLCAAIAEQGAENWHQVKIAQEEQ